MLKSDIKLHEKMYRLFKIRVVLMIDKIRSRISFDDILKFKQKRWSIDIENPKTFDDKLWYMKKYFYSPLAVKCADKVRVREYVKECGLEEILVPVYGVYEKMEEIDFSDIPDKSYIKCNHSSGGNYLYRKNQTDEAWLRKLFNLYLKRNYYNESKEWVYKDISPRIIIEKELKSKEPLRDYRMFCFDGEVKVVMVNVGTATENGEHAKNVFRSFYTPDFEQIKDLRILGDEAASKGLTKPKGWNEMVDIAQKLSKPFAFCRVDLYNIDGKIYLSEMTFFPNAGINNFQPQEWALKLGSWIDLEKCKDNPTYEYHD